MTTSIAETQRRRDKLKGARAAGVDPYPHLDLQQRSLVSEVLPDSQRRHVGGADGRSESYHLAGRLVARRKNRESMIVDLQDRSGTIRLCVDSATSESQLLDCDIGDIVAVSGRAYVTSDGKLCLHVESGSLLAKAVRRPPAARHIGEVHAGNRRELELIAYADMRELFVKRAAVIAAVREGLRQADFIEVETPILQVLKGGPLARPFLSHHNALRREVSLRISAQLLLQRCLVGGFERVYELGKSFRNEGISRKHSPEFTLLEWGMVYSDYHDAATFVEDLLTGAVEQALGTVSITYNGTAIDLARPWRRVTLQEAILERTGVDILHAAHEEIVAVLPGDRSPGLSWSEAVTRAYAERVEPYLIQPTIVCDLPLEAHPCIKRHREWPQLSEGFEVVIGGVEICSGGTGLNNPDEQWERFAQQCGDKAGQDEPYPNDQEYVAALEYGMPPISGGGVGIDRLLKVVLGRDSILDVLLFPASWSYASAPGAPS